jgi:hypothetical protein
MAYLPEEQAAFVGKPLLLAECRVGLAREAGAEDIMRGDRSIVNFEHVAVLVRGPGEVIAVTLARDGVHLTTENTFSPKR